MRRVERKKSTFIERCGSAIDSVVGVFSPRNAFVRERYRAAQRQLSGYRGARRDRPRSNWAPGSGSADAEILGDLEELRDRSHDLARNDPLASAVVQTINVNTIGPGLRYQSRVDRDALGISPESARALNRANERAWNAWTPHADAAGILDFEAMQSQIDISILVSGETFLIPRMLREPRCPYDLRLQVVEAHRVATPPEFTTDPYVREGVRIDERYGRPLAYYVRRAHPGEERRTPEADSWETIPAWNERAGRPNVLHLFHQTRPGQHRGEPFFAPVLNYFHDLDRYLEAELIASRVAACFGLIIESEDPVADALAASSGEDAGGLPIEEMTPGMIERVRAGSKVTQVNPLRPGAQFDPFMARVTKAIASGLGLPVQLVLKDFAGMNYSSARTALLEAWRYFSCRQTWFARRFCRPVNQWLLEEAWLRGALPVRDFYRQQDAYTRSVWIPAARGWVDPEKEATAATMRVTSYQSTHAIEAAAQGHDFEEILEQRRLEEELIRDAGLPATGAAGGGGGGGGDDGGGGQPRDADDDEAEDEEEREEEEDDDERSAA